MAQVIEITSPRINHGAILVAGDAAVQIVAYFGDVTGDQSYSGLDASYIARAVVGLDTGFDRFERIDPLILGDVTGNGRLSALDASYIARKAVGLPQPEIPDLPPTSAPGPAPVISMQIQWTSIDVSAAHSLEKGETLSRDHFEMPRADRPLATSVNAMLESATAPKMTDGPSIGLADDDPVLASTKDRDRSIREEIFSEIAADDRF
jgi:hypothetical protein